MTDECCKRSETISLEEICSEIASDSDSKGLSPVKVVCDPQVIHRDSVQSFVENA